VSEGINLMRLTALGNQACIVPLVLLCYTQETGSIGNGELDSKMPMRLIVSEFTEV
jgi:hypothetical protein